MDAAVRVREINAAREKIGEAPYLGGDRGIRESFEFGLCEELVLNDPNYYQKAIKREEAERKATREQKAQEARERAERKERKQTAEQSMHKSKITEFKTGIGVYVLKCGIAHYGLDFEKRLFSMGLIDRNALTVSIPMENFRMSESMLEFEGKPRYINQMRKYVYNFQSGLQQQETKVTESDSGTSQTSKEEVQERDCLIVG